MLGRALAAALPYLPRRLIGRVAGRYIAGPEMPDAIALARRLGGVGFATTIDQLGEDVTEPAGAAAATAGYVRLIAAIAEAGVARNVSVKLSQLGLRIDPELACANLSELLAAALPRDVFVRVDMEDASTTDATLAIYLRVRREWPRVGVVLQARLKRTAADARALAAAGANVRLCKGIYPEHAGIALQDPEEIREAYLDALGALLAGGAYVGVATHDLPLIARAQREIAARGAGRDRYEFQALLGVPMRAELERLRDAGNTVRLYVPFGADWYAYSLRRLRENPGMAWAIAKGLFKRDGLGREPSRDGAGLDTRAPRS